VRSKIWKFPLEVVDVQEVEMPSGAKLLSVDCQQGCLCLWALVDLDRATKERHLIEIIGIGNPIESHHRSFIGTVQMGAFVWHIFQRKTLTSQGAIK